MDETEKFFVYRTASRNRVSDYFDSRDQASLVAANMNWDEKDKKYASASAVFYGEQVLRTVPAGLVTALPKVGR